MLLFLNFKCILSRQCCIYRIQYNSYMQCPGRVVEGAEIGILMARRAVKSLGDKLILSQHAAVKKAKA